MTQKIGISTLTFDLDGGFVLEVKDEDFMGNMSAGRRMTRTATLDGGAYLVDNGYSVADRTLTIHPAPSITQEELLNLQRLFKTYGNVLLLTPEGAFNAAPYTFAATNGVVTASFMVKSTGEVKQ